MLPFIVTTTGRNLQPVIPNDAESIFDDEGRPALIYRISVAESQV